MAEIVYILGAGINYGIRDWHGNRPPLATDFFQQALKHPKTGSDRYRERLKALFDYIQRFWKLSVEQLESTPFDLEACYTLIQLQAVEARLQKDRDKLILLSELEYRLTTLLAEYLSELASFTHSSASFRVLGNIIYAEKPAVLTFNYDTLLESTIESASPLHGKLPAFMINPTSGELLDEELPYSYHKWNRPLAYGVKFDDVQLHRPSVHVFASGERFYSHPDNKFYDAPLLKLHGSINWFAYTGIKRYSFSENEKQENRAGKTVLFSGSWWFNEPPDLFGEIIQPIIITPVLNKDLHQKPIIREIWVRAYQELLTCKRLIVGGYSFPPTDFNTRRLFLEAFSEHSPEEIIVINPDTRVVQLIKDLCHFKKPVLACRDLDEFVSLYMRP
jgi:hypothetical protein